jgi:3-oxosteroid 1-dehydrogenase
MRPPERGHLLRHTLEQNWRERSRWGQPIAGLYATGNSMAAVSGCTYPGGGNPVGSSMVFAYLAARHMADLG